MVSRRRARRAGAAAPKGGQGVRSGAVAVSAICAAVMAAGRGAMASHRSAARLWGIPRPEGDPIDVLLPRRTREAAVSGACVHRPRDLLDLSPVLRTNIPTTNILRTLCDLGALDPPAVPGAVGHVVTTGLASPVALCARRSPATGDGDGLACQRCVTLSMSGCSMASPSTASSSRRCDGCSAGSRPAARRVPPRHRRLRGRFPHHRQPDRPGVRRVVDPRPRQGAVREGPDPRRRPVRCRLRRAAIHLSGHRASSSEGGGAHSAQRAAVGAPVVGRDLCQRLTENPPRRRSGGNPAQNVGALFRFTASARRCTGAAPCR